MKNPLSLLRAARKRHSSTQTALKEASVKPKDSLDLSTSFHSLPAELQYQIYLYALSNLEIRVVLEDQRGLKAITASDPGNPMYTLSSTSILQLHFYQKALFPLATTWRPVRWESHVLFTFPSALSMIDIFASPSWPSSRLRLVQRVRLFERQFFHSNGRNSGAYGVVEVLSFLFTRSLSPTTFEYAPVLPLTQFVDSPYGAQFQRLVCSPCWRYLHILSVKQKFKYEDYTSITKILGRTKYQNRRVARLIDLPGTSKVLKNRRGEVSGIIATCQSSSAEEIFHYRLVVPDAIGRENWLDGQGIDVQMVIEKLGSEWENYLRVGLDGFEKLAELVRNRSVWVDKRTTGQINDCFL